MVRIRFWLVAGVLVALLAGSGAVTANAMPVGSATAQGACGPSSAEGWQAMFAALPTYGDGNVSAQLDASRCVVLTGDAIPRDGGAWAHSTITLVADGTARVLRPAYPNTASPYQVIPDRGDGTVDWLGSAFFAGATLYSISPRVRPIAGGWESIEVNIAVFDVPAGGDPRFSRFLATPTLAAGPIHWSGGIVNDSASGYVYIFGSSVAATDGWTGHDVFVARVRLRDLGTVTRWRFFSWGSWTNEQAAATPILRSSVNGGTETVFSAWKDPSGWKLTSKRGGQWGPGDIVRWTTPTLGAAWTETVVANVPGDHYIHFEHRALPLTATGRRLLTYNTAGTDATWISVAP